MTPFFGNGATPIALGLKVLETRGLFLRVPLELSYAWMCVWLLWVKRKWAGFGIEGQKRLYLGKGRS